MRVRTVAGWIAVGAGILLLVGGAAASFMPTVATVAGPLGAAPASACQETGLMGTGGDHMGGSIGMMGGAGRLASGMMHSGAGQCSAAAQRTEARIPGAIEVQVRTANFAFTPRETRLPRATAVNLTLDNPASTGTAHDLTVPGLGIHLMAGPGETVTIGLRDLAPGRYDGYCAIPGHANAGMRATIIVE